MISSGSHGSSDQDFVDFLENELEMGGHEVTETTRASSNADRVSADSEADTGYFTCPAALKCDLGPNLDCLFIELQTCEGYCKAC